MIPSLLLYNRYYYYITLPVLLISDRTLPFVFPNSAFYKLIESNIDAETNFLRQYLLFMKRI